MPVHRTCSDSRVWPRTTPCDAGVPGVQEWVVTRLQEGSEALSGRVYFIQRCTAAKIIAKGILGIASPGNCDLL